MLRCIPQYE